jgi:uncharacterized protein (TIGR02611 family)
MNHLLRQGKRIGTAIGGGLVFIFGLILIPYPGPGWLVVFAGLAILSTEFEFAAKWLKWLKSKYKTWTAWVKRQPKIVQVHIIGFTGLIVLATIWLLNTFGLIDNLFNLDQDWMHSPILNK